MSSAMYLNIRTPRGKESLLMPLSSPSAREERKEMKEEKKEMKEDRTEMKGKIPWSFMTAGALYFTIRRSLQDT